MVARNLAFWWERSRTSKVAIALILHVRFFCTPITLRRIGISSNHSSNHNGRAHKSSLFRFYLSHATRLFLYITWIYNFSFRMYSLRYSRIKKHPDHQDLVHPETPSDNLPTATICHGKIHFRPTQGRRRVGSSIHLLANGACSVSLQKPGVSKT